MGKPLVPARIENVHDLYEATLGNRAADNVRRVEVPLELLDFAVDPSGQRLIGNPEHGGEHMLELY